MNNGMIETRWTYVKEFLDARTNVSPQFVEDDRQVHIIAADDFFKVACVINKDSDDETNDLTDWETNYVSRANKTLQPRTSDQRVLGAPNRIPPGVTVYPGGISDDIVNGAHGGGTELKLYNDLVAPVLSVDYRSLNHFYAIGGRAVWENASVADYIDAELIALASTGFAVEAGDYEIYELIPSTGLGVFVPASGGPGTGTHNLNLSETLNGNVSILANTPVPVAGNIGWFDYDSDNNILTANATQNGGYNLYNFDITMFAFGRRLWGRKLDGAESIYESTDIVGKLLFNTWTIRFTLIPTGVDATVGLILNVGVKSNV